MKVSSMESGSQSKRKSLPSDVAERPELVSHLVCVLVKIKIVGGLHCEKSVK